MCSKQIAAEVNGAETYSNIERYELKPGQSILLEVPIDAYWNTSNLPKDPGEYRTDVMVNLYPDGLDSNASDNWYYFNTEFQ